MDRLLVGTSKGLVTFQDKNEIDYQYEGLNVTAIYGELIGITHKHWGVMLYRNDQRLQVPVFDKNLKTVDGKAANLRQIWHIEGGGKQYPNRIWLATEPGALFRSDDRGESWQLIKGLWDHPTRRLHGQWFGAGKDLPFVHSIIVHPENNDCIYISVSCAGVFRSLDSGITWDTMNKGMKAEYLPNPHPVAGYDPHQVLMHPKEHNVLWQQNHCGIYRSSDGGQHWKTVSDQYGFCIAIDEENPDAAWVLPVENETARIPKDKKLQMWHTVNGGETWEDCSIGLPKEHFYSIVLRNGLAKKGDQMAFGTTNGNVFYSANKGKTWETISTNLAKVNYIRFSNEL